MTPVDQEPSSAAEPPWPKPRAAWYVVAVLILAFTSSFIDRQIMSLLVGPIRADLNISDTQFSLLVGLAFAIFYSFMGLPIAWLADRYNRRNIVMVGVAAWSIMTALCGVADSFWKLFFARMGVGIGEATLTPAATSLIADYFPREKRGRATAIYATGVYWGSGLALMIGGLIIHLLDSAPYTVVPILGSIASWRLVFFYVGLPGLLLALLMITIREPVRRETAPPVAADTAVKAGPGLASVLRDQAAAIVPIFIGFTVLGMVVVGYLSWIPALFIRTWGWSVSSIGFAFGAIVLAAGSGGMICGGWLCDTLTRRGHADAAVRAGLYGGFAAIPFVILAPLAPTPELALVLTAIGFFCLTSTQALPVIAVQMIAPNHLRAQLVAVYFMVGSLLIFTLGPTIVALITDYVFHDDAKLRYALAIASGILAPLGAVITWLALKPYRATVEALDL